MLATTTRKEVGERRVLLSRNALGRNRFSLARLASALSHGVRPVSENFTPSTLPVGVRKFTCANVLILCPVITHDSHRVSRSTGAIDRFWPGGDRCAVESHRVNAFDSGSAAVGRFATRSDPWRTAALELSSYLICRSIRK